MAILAGDGGAAPAQYLPPSELPGATIQDTQPWAPGSDPAGEAAALQAVAEYNAPPAFVAAAGLTPALPSSPPPADSPPSGAAVPSYGAPAAPPFGPAQPALTFNLSLAGGGRPAAGGGAPVLRGGSFHGGIGGVARVLEHLGLAGHRRLPRHLEHATRTPLIP